MGAKVRTKLVRNFGAFCLTQVAQLAVDTTSGAAKAIGAEKIIMTNTKKNDTIRLTSLDIDLTSERMINMKLRYPIGLCILMFIGSFLLYETNPSDTISSLYWILFTIAVMGTIAYSIYTFVKFLFREIKEIIIAAKKEPHKNKEPWE